MSFTRFVTWFEQEFSTIRIVSTKYATEYQVIVFLVANGGWINLNVYKEKIQLDFMYR